MKANAGLGDIMNKGKHMAFKTLKNIECLNWEMCDKGLKFTNIECI